MPSSLFPQIEPCEGLCCFVCSDVDRVSRMIASVTVNENARSFFVSYIETMKQSEVTASQHILPLEFFEHSPVSA